MDAAITLPGISRTFLTHLGVRGLADDRYVVERFRSMADGDIRRVAGEAPEAKGGQRKAKRVTATLKAVQALRPERNEIIICTGLRIKGAGVQYWGSLASGLFCDRKQKG